MAGEREILMVPFFGQGHLFPFSELAHRLACCGHRCTIIVPSDLSPSLISTCSDEPRIHVHPLILPSSPDGTPPGLFGRMHLMTDALSALFAEKATSANQPLCIVLDFNLGRAIDVCKGSGIPIVAFSTSAAFSAAVDYAKTTIPPVTGEWNPSETVHIAGFPGDLQFTHGDLTPKSQMRIIQGGHGSTPGRHGAGPPGGPSGSLPGRFPPWLVDRDAAVAFLFNTCDHLERPFLDYMAKELGKPFFGVGPLLPQKFWDSVKSIVRDDSARARNRSGLKESDAEAWLDTKPRGSVIYVAFGTEVSPSPSELAALADGLEECNRPFIWVVQPGLAENLHGSPASPNLNLDEFEERVKGRGVLVRGWAPQLLILSHPSTGSFLTHCGWNSTMESLARGVPLLAWPVRGDQHPNAKLISSYLKVGVQVRTSDREVSKEDVVGAVERLVANDDIRRHAAEISRFFANGFPATSTSSLEAFIGFITCAKE